MKSIYSIEVLQRILDHWGINTIRNVTYFENIGRNIWRHFIETDRGEFELFSYPDSEDEYAQAKLKEFLSDIHRDLDLAQKHEVVHSFDRHHVLVQLSKKNHITVKQAAKDLDLLLGLTIKKAFRVYGSIFQIHLGDADVDTASTLVSFGWWSIHTTEKGQTNVVVTTGSHGIDDLDTAIASLESDMPSIKEYILKDEWFELFLSNGMSLHFVSTNSFPAIEIHLAFKKNRLVIVNERTLYYTRSF